VLSPQACFSADGNFVAAGSTTGGVFVWNTHTAALEAHITEGHQCVSPAFSNRIATR
jgi:WD40 repeat protein